MAHYVLVHGAWHGGWCWRKVVPLLAAAGHTADALDLPGHGDDHTPLDGRTFDAYVNSVCDHIFAAEGPVVLVGHSLGGMTVAQVCEQIPERLHTVVYVCAFLPGDGQGIPDLVSSGMQESVALANDVVIEQTQSTIVAPHALRDALYGECDDADVAFARSHLVPETIVSQRPAVHLSTARAETVPRAYVECLRDRAIPIAKQRQMCADASATVLASIDTDHSPFFSRPTELAGALVTAAGEVAAPVSRG